MADVTKVLNSIEAGDPKAAAELLPLVYEELRKLAAVRLAAEKPGQTLQATALVHEAYVRLVGANQPEEWNGRGHFFAAAAEAMRRILVEAARRKRRTKCGGDLKRVDLDAVEPAAGSGPDETIRIDEAISQLAAHDPLAARLVSLRYFAGLSMEEAATAAGISRSMAYERWTYAKAWVHRAVQGGS